MARTDEEEFIERMQICKAIIDGDHEALAKQWEIKAIRWDGIIEAETAEGLQSEIDKFTELLEKQQSYVFTILYVSYFSLWGFSRELIEPDIWGVIGFLGTISVSLFLANLLYLTHFVRDLINKASREFLPIIHDALQSEDSGPREVRDCVLRYQNFKFSRVSDFRVHSDILSEFSIGTGVVGLVIMLVAYSEII